MLLPVVRCLPSVISPFNTTYLNKGLSKQCEYRWEGAHSSHLICIYTVCLLISLFFLSLNFCRFNIPISLTWATGPSACLTRSRGLEFDPGLVPHLCGDCWSLNNFYGHSPPVSWCIQDGFLSVTSESVCTNYW